MNKKQATGKGSPKTENLRREAERRLPLKKTRAIKKMTDDAVRSLLHELDVHQIELEMQNEELLNAQTSLQEASDKYQDLFDFAPVGYFRLSKQGQILEVNLVGAALLGLDRRTVVKQRFDQFVTLKHRVAFTDFCRCVSTTAMKQICEIELRRKEEPVCVLMEAIPSRVCKGDLNITVTDISDRSRAEQALRQSRDELQTIYDGMIDGILIADTKTKRFVKSNPAMRRMLGYFEEELHSMSVMDIHPSQALPSILERFQAGMEGQLPMAEDTPVLTKDGTLIYADIGYNFLNYGGQPCLIKFFHDITESMRAEKALRESEEQFRDLYENAPNGYFSIDADGCIQRCNQRAGELLKYTVQQLMGKPVSDLYADTPQGKAKAAKMLDRFRAGDTICDELAEMQTADGASVWISLSVNPVRNAMGQIIESRSIVVDVTERWKAEEALRLANAELDVRVAERTAELSQTIDKLKEEVALRIAIEETLRRQSEQLRALASDLTLAEQHERKRLSNILHDHIQQLLVAARIQLELIKRTSDMEQMHATAQLASDILKETIDASRTLTVELSPPALHHAGLIGGLKWLAANMLEKNQFAVNLNLDKGAEPSSEDMRLLLFECVRELLFNSMKHSGAVEAQVALMQTKNDHIKIVVRDSGNGFDPNQLHKRSAIKVTFGLFGIQQRLNHFGGDMDIVAAPSKGTCITLLVPIGKAKPFREDKDKTPTRIIKIDKVPMRKGTQIR
jgi:PAS domain S-box-containing protein